MTGPRARYVYYVGDSGPVDYEAAVELVWGSGPTEEEWQRFEQLERNVGRHSS